MDDLLIIPPRLFVIWKRTFGLYTYYMGYLTSEMAKTVLQVKRNFDNTGDKSLIGMNLEQLNEYAGRHGLCEFPDKKEIDDVLPRIWDYLEKYDLSDFAVSPEKWDELMKYLDEMGRKQ